MTRFQFGLRAALVGMTFLCVATAIGREWRYQSRLHVIQADIKEEIATCERMEPRDARVQLGMVRQMLDATPVLRNHDRATLRKPLDTAIAITRSRCLYKELLSNCGADRDPHFVYQWWNSEPQPTCGDR